MPPLEDIFIIRHGESDEDVNPEMKGVIHNSEMALTPKGIEQAHEVAEKLKGEIVNSDEVTFYVSPYKRAQQTAKIILDTLKNDKIKMITEPSIRSLNWGDTTMENLKEREQERYRVGVLHYNFPNGDRSPEYVENIYDFVYRIIKEKHIDNNKRECVVIVGHGFSLRIIVKAFTEMSEDDFKWIKNPPNTHVARIYFDSQKNNFYMREPLPVRDPNQVE